MVVLGGGAVSYERGTPVQSPLAAEGREQVMSPGCVHNPQAMRPMGVHNPTGYEA